MRAPKRRNSLSVGVLRLERDLEVMARHRLVEGRGREAVERPLRRVVGVEEVDAGAGAVRRRLDVERRRRVALLVRLDGTHLHGGHRQPAEPAGRDGGRARDLVGGQRDHRGRLGGVVGRVDLERCPQGRDVCVPQLASDRRSSPPGWPRCAPDRSHGWHARPRPGWCTRGCGTRTPPRRRAASRCRRPAARTARSPRARRRSGPAPG